MIPSPLRTRTSFSRTLLALVALAMASHAAPRGTLTIPGTGVSLVPPANVRLPKLGSTLVDPTGRLTIAILVSNSGVDLEADPIFRTAYPAPPEPFSHNGVAGNLYRRNKTPNGKGYDGWWLNVKRGRRVLMIIAANTGPTGDVMAQLKRSLESLTWNERIYDPEAAFGAKLTTPGYVLDARGTALLNYSRVGISGDTIATIGFTSMPTPEGRAQEMVPSECGKLLPIPFQGRTHTEPHGLRSGPFNACDAWTTTRTPLSYQMLLAVGPQNLLMLDAESNGSDAPVSPTTFRDIMKDDFLLLR